MKAPPITKNDESIKKICIGGMLSKKIVRSKYSIENPRKKIAAPVNIAVIGSHHLEG